MTTDQMTRLLGLSRAVSLRVRKELLEYVRLHRSRPSLDIEMELSRVAIQAVGKALDEAVEIIVKEQ